MVWKTSAYTRCIVIHISYSGCHLSSWNITMNNLNKCIIFQILRKTERAKKQRAFTILVSPSSIMVSFSTLFYTCVQLCAFISIPKHLTWYRPFMTWCRWCNIGNSKLIGIVALLHFSFSFILWSMAKNKYFARRLNVYFIKLNELFLR